MTQHTSAAAFTTGLFLASKFGVYGVGFGVLTGWYTHHARHSLILV